MFLICDDEAGIHESLRLYLERDGFAVHSVYRGDAVTDAFFSLSPDLVILDIMMPGKSGTDICAEIRRYSAVPIIMLTAKGEEVDRLLGFELGADDYIVKPFSPREVVSRIHLIFRRSGQRHQIHRRRRQGGDRSPIAGRRRLFLREGQWGGDGQRDGGKDIRPVLPG